MYVCMYVYMYVCMYVKLIYFKLVYNDGRYSYIKLIKANYQYEVQISI